MSNSIISGSLIEFASIQLSFDVCKIKKKLQIYEIMRKRLCTNSSKTIVGGWWDWNCQESEGGKGVFFFWRKQWLLKKYGYHWNSAFIFLIRIRISKNNIFIT